MKNLKRVTLTLFVSCLLTVFGSNGLAQKPDDETPIKVNTVLLNLPIVASGKNGSVVNELKKGDISIFQDGEKQIVEYFAAAEEPMTVAVIIDVSASTRNVLTGIRKAACDFIATFGDEDKGTVVTFASDVRVLAQLTGDHKKLDSAIKSASVPFEGQGSEKMYDAIHQIVTKDFNGVKGRKAIVVLTDGEAGGIKVSDKELLNSLTESDILVYPIYYQTRAFKGPQTMTMDEFVKRPWISFLQSMAVTTGGKLFVAGSEGFPGAFQQISDDLKKYYVVGFYPNREDGSSNNIQIKVDRENVTVRTKGTIRLKATTAELKK